MTDPAQTPFSPPLGISHTRITIAYIGVCLITMAVSAFAGLWIAVLYDLDHVLFGHGTTAHLETFGLIAGAALGLCAAILWTGDAVRLARAGRLHEDTLCNSSVPPSPCSMPFVPEPVSNITDGKDAARPSVHAQARSNNRLISTALSLALAAALLAHASVMYAQALIRQESPNWSHFVVRFLIFGIISALLAGAVAGGLSMALARFLLKPRKYPAPEGV